MAARDATYIFVSSRIRRDARYILFPLQNRNILFFDSLLLWFVSCIGLLVVVAVQIVSASDVKFDDIQDIASDASSKNIGKMSGDRPEANEKDHSKTTDIPLQSAPSKKVLGPLGRMKSNLKKKNDDSKDLSKKLQCSLEKASKESHELRKRITMVILTIGFLPFLGTVAMYILIRAQLLDPYEVGHYGYYGAAAQWLVPMTALVVMPNDGFLVRFFVVTLVLYPTLALFSELFEAVDAYFLEREMPLRNPDARTAYTCENNISCGLYVSRSLCLAVTNAVTIYHALQLLEKNEGMVVYDFSKEKGKRYNDEAFKMSGRRTLNKIWFIGRSYVTSFGVVFTIYAIIFHAMGDSVSWYENEMFQSQIFLGANSVFAAFVFSDQRRGVIMAYLTSILAAGEAQSAAAIAALLGGQNATQSFSLAKESFRSICFTDLSVEDFAKNTEDANSKNQLHEKTTKTILGKCDAFISHSWHDDGEQKFEVLQKWSAEFKKKTGREPQYWLDKACIDQNNISNSLLCLPIFLGKTRFQTHRYHPIDAIKFQF